MIKTAMTALLLFAAVVWLFLYAMVFEPAFGSPAVAAAPVDVDEVGLFVNVLAWSLVIFLGRKRRVLP